FAAAPGLGPLAAVLALIYLVPVATFRLHARRFPLRAGGSHLTGRAYSPWWGGHPIQLLYVAIPPPAGILRLGPGRYSGWLRLWGARIGRRVHWPPRVEITDRSLLDIGDDVVLGHQVVLYGHVIRPHRDGLVLYLKPIVVGDGAFLGAHSIIGPGAVV